MTFASKAEESGLKKQKEEMLRINQEDNNGSMILCWLNAKCRYITFKMMVNDVPQTHEATFKKQGFQIGKSLPFATDYQKWVRHFHRPLRHKNQFAFYGKC